MKYLKLKNQLLGEDEVYSQEEGWKIVDDCNAAEEKDKEAAAKPKLGPRVREDGDVD